MTSKLFCHHFIDPNTYNVRKNAVSLHSISLFVLAVSNNIKLFPGVFFSFFFFRFYTVPHEKVSKMNYFIHPVQIKNKINTHKNNLYMTCTQNWEVPVSYQWCHTITRERARENSVGNTACRKSSSKIVAKSTARSVTKLFTRIMFD